MSTRASHLTAAHEALSIIHKLISKEEQYVHDLDTIDRETLSQFFTACENAIDSMTPMSMTTAKESDDFIGEVNRCMDKLHDLELKFCDIPNILRMQSLMTVKIAQAYVASATFQPQGSRI